MAHPAVDQILQYFAYEHLPAQLQEISKPYHDLAHKTAQDSPDSPETTVALRKLLEAKDAAVRAKLPKRVEAPTRVTTNQRTDEQREAVEKAARSGWSATQKPEE